MSESNWDWVQGAFDPGGCLTFVRDTTQTEILRAFDIDPATTRVLSEAQLETDPVLSQAGFDEGTQWIRVAPAGPQWTVVIEHVQMKAEVDNIAARIGLDHETLMVSYNAKEHGSLQYFRQGQLELGFVVGHPYDSRFGRSRTLFERDLRDNRLLHFGGGDDPRRDLVTTIALFANKLGFQLDPHTYNGSLPTAYRTHPYTYRQPGP